jgi:hypothetical protein
MNRTEAAILYEHYETAAWAIRAVLRVEPIETDMVLDPCVGSGIIAKAIIDRHPEKVVAAVDIYEWGYHLDWKIDFLKADFDLSGYTVIMNPPFSKACEFVEHAFRLGARKVICFQRMAWYESRERAMFFNMLPPDRIWLCGDRATCWRHDISPTDRKIDPKTGKKRTGSTTPHAWFIFVAGSKPGAGTVIDKIWKLKGEKS